MNLQSLGEVLTVKAHLGDHSEVIVSDFACRDCARCRSGARLGGGGLLNDRRAGERPPMQRAGQAEHAQSETVAAYHSACPRFSARSAKRAGEMARCK